MIKADYPGLTTQAQDLLIKFQKKPSTLVVG